MTDTMKISTLDATSLKITSQSPSEILTGFDNITVNNSTYTTSIGTGGWQGLTSLATDQLNPLTLNQITTLSLDEYATRITSLKVIKYIIAGNKTEYDLYIKTKGYDPNEYVYLDDPDMLIGSHNIHGFYVGSWRDRDDIKEIKERIILCNMR